MSLLSKFTKRSNLSPLEKLAQDSLTQLETKLENAVEDLFASALRSSGLSAGVARELAARFGDSIKYELASRYFQSAGAEYNRVSREDICNNLLPGYADTASGEVRRIRRNFINVAGVDTNNVLQYPSQIGKYYMTMSFRKYVRQAPQVQTSLEFDNAIVLPVPRKIEDNFNINVSEKALGTAGAVSDVIQTISAGAGEDYSPSQALLFSFMAKTIGELSDSAGSALGSYLGSVPNPHVAAIFQGVGLRQHNFEWTFTPRNPEESAALQRVILKLKQNALPTFSTVGTPIFQYPLMCQIKLEPWDREGAELIKYKPAMLQDVRVSYSPNGIPSFFAGTNLPTFIQISLQFIETTYFTANDFGRESFNDDQLQSIIDGGSDLLGEYVPQGIQDTFNDVVDGLDGILRGDD